MSEPASCQVHGPVRPLGSVPATTVQAPSSGPSELAGMSASVTFGQCETCGQWLVTVGLGDQGSGRSWWSPLSGLRGDPHA